MYLCGAHGVNKGVGLSDLNMYEYSKHIFVSIRLLNTLNQSNLVVTFTTHGIHCIEKENIPVTRL